MMTMDLFDYVSDVGRVIFWASAAFIAVSFAWAWACVLPHYMAKLFFRARAARYGAKARALRAKIAWLEQEPD